MTARARFAARLAGHHACQQRLAARGLIQLSSAGATVAPPAGEPTSTGDPVGDGACFPVERTAGTPHAGAPGSASQRPVLDQTA